MKKAINSTGRPTRRVSGAVLAGAVTAALALAACSSKDILTVPDVDVVKPSALTGKNALPSVLAAAIGDFQVAFGGSGSPNGGSEGQAQMSGLLADEFINAESFPTRIEVDQRNTQVINATMLTIFRDIEKARATSEFAERAYEKLDAANFSRGEATALAAYSYVILAENYCSGVPSSFIDDAGNLNFGAPLTTAQMYTIASAKFDTAMTLAAAAGNTTALNMARIGKGRTLLDQGLANVAAAATVVGPVPSGFRYLIQHDENTTRQNNGIFLFAQNGRRFSIPDNEGTNGLPFRTDGLTDPRISTRRLSGTAGIGFDNATPLFITAKYPSRGQAALPAPTPLAEGIEARLIEAEAALAASNDPAYLAGINAARAAVTVYSNPPGGPAPAKPAAILVAPATAAAKVDLLFKERAYDMFLTSHRVGDLRRLIRQYGRGSETVFPTGAYLKGGVYGPDVNFPIPFEEKNNPQFTACLDRSA